MTINPRTKAVELTSTELRRAVAEYLKTKFNITSNPEDVNLSPIEPTAAVEVYRWDNVEPEPEEMRYQLS